MPGGIINVISANDAYPTFEIDLNHLMDDVAIIGRVEMVLDAVSDLIVAKQHWIF